MQDFQNFMTSAFYLVEVVSILFIVAQFTLFVITKEANKVKNHTHPLENFFSQKVSIQSDISTIVECQPTELVEPVSDISTIAECQLSELSSVSNVPNLSIFSGEASHEKCVVAFTKDEEETHEPVLVFDELNTTDVIKKLMLDEARVIAKRLNITLRTGNTRKRLQQLKNEILLKPQDEIIEALKQ